MSIDETDKVDFIGIQKISNEVVLSISDHLDWEATEIHIEILQDKINAYLRFIESGELYISYPGAKDKSKIVIEVVLKHQPNQKAMEFFKHVEETLEKAGVVFRYWRPDPTTKNTL